MPVYDPSLASGRPALDMVRDHDFERIVKAVEAIPRIAAKYGIHRCISFSRIELRSLLIRLQVRVPDTPQRAVAIHRIHRHLEEGYIRVYARSDLAGRNARDDFLEGVAMDLLLPAIQAAFAASQTVISSSYRPELSGHERMGDTEP